MRIGTNPSVGRWRLICLVLITLGFVASGYLLARTFALMQDEPLEVIDVCAVVFGSGCDETMLSDTAWRLGIPLAGWGVVYYGTIGCLVLMAWTLGKDFRHEATVGAFWLALIGLCISVLLTISMLTGRAQICGLCLFIHVVNLALVPSLKYLTGNSFLEIVSTLLAAGRYLVGGKTDPIGVAHWKAVGFITVGLVATVLYQWVLVEAERRVATSYAAIDEMVLARFARAPQQNVPVSADDPRLGQGAAQVQLVVFSSFQCPGCKGFAAELYRLRDRFPNELAITFKHYPLGTLCNDAIAADMHPQACGAAWAAASAHRQDKFWAFHDALFEADISGGEATLVSIAQQLGLDEARFREDLVARETKEQIRADIELGTRLGVDSTPAVFLNGCRVRHVSSRALGLLITSVIEDPSD